MLKMLSWLLREIKVWPEGLVSIKSRTGPAEFQKNKCWTKKIRHQTCALHSLRQVLLKQSACLLTAKEKGTDFQKAFLI